MTLIRISRTNFGPTTFLSSSASPSATYGLPIAHQYLASSCAVTVDHTRIECLSTVGIGKGHTWIVAVGNQTSPASTATTAYKIPAIESLSGSGIVSGSTGGGEQIVVSGTDFGPAHIVPILSYGDANDASSLYYGTSCSVSVAHTQITCLSAEGTGKDHAMSVRVGGQNSTWSVQNVSYAAPTIYNYVTEWVVETSDDGASTSGGQFVMLEGSDFGPVSESADSVQYGA